MQRWTDEQLRAAVVGSRNTSQTLRALGLRSVGGNYDTIRRRIAELGLDTSHWRRLNGAIVEDDALRTAVAESRSIAECLRILGWADSGSNRQRLRNLVRTRGLDTSHFLGQRANLGREFPQFRRPIEGYLRLGGPPIKSTVLRLRLLHEGIVDPRCALCDRDTWQSQPMPLELDHINGDRYDNRLENLRLLCPNCHALTPTYRGRNRGRYADLGA